MLGGGNPVGGQNPMGISQLLNYIGNHAYAYSGKVEVDNTDTTLLKFRTNNTYFVGKYQPQYMDDGTLTHNLRTDIKLDGQLIAQVEVTSSLDYTPFDEIHLIIPPFTDVLVTAIVLTASGPYGFGGIITGEVYGGN